MKIINDNSKVYVLCPAYFKTGGTELVHQLVNELNNNGVRAFITYFWTKDIEKEKNINPEFRKYVSEYKRIDEIEDDRTNIIVFPETRVKFVKKYKKAIKIIWWMSVDNYLEDCFYSFGKCRKKYGFISAFIRLVSGTLNTDKLIKLADYNLCQSQYAIDFCEKKEAKNILYLSDYISEEYNLDWKVEGRDNVVLYNPKKGKEFTEKLINRAKDIEFVPLINMTSQEVRNRLVRSKLYIDFGNHPGKDRFPREAAYSGCCIITGRRGSAAFKEDVLIGEEYKFFENESEIDEIVEKIRYCLNNYEAVINDFDEYRICIGKEKEKFASDVKKIFEKMETGYEKSSIN